jgi:integrase
MARTKKQKRATSFVTLRKQKLSKGRESYYLDIYKDGVRHYEFLKLYLVPVVDEATKVQNQNTKQAAEAIRSAREVEIIQTKGGIATDKFSDMLLSDLVENYRKQKLETGQSTRRAETCECLWKHLVKFKGEKTTLGQIDEKFCKDFIVYLSKAKCHNLPKPKDKKVKDNNQAKERLLSSATANSYFLLFSCILNDAERKKIIEKNPIHYLTREDRKPIKAEESTRSYLTIDEVKKLMDTDCKNQMVKSAFIFSCFTGLRLSDVTNLKWDNIIKRDGDLFAELIMQKTRDAIIIKLNKQAIKCLPEKKGDFVFEMPLYREAVNRHLKEWAKKAGIEKNICYHMSRHTFATMELTMGGDLYVISKLMGHKEIATTQVYADIINKKREETVDLLDEAFK